MDEIEVYRTAKQIIDEYGVDAPLYVAKRSDVMRQRGNLMGAAVWKRIAWAVSRLEVAKGRTTH
jgi:hypothetical protein